MTTYTAAGIDHASTNMSCSYVHSGGVVEAVRNNRGSSATPSMVFFPPDGGEPIVGEAARTQGKLNPGNVVHDAKPFLGRLGHVMAKINGKDIGPEDVATALIKDQLNAIRAASGCEVKALAVGKPADYGAEESEALERAIRAAGYDGALRLVNEPEAAALYAVGQSITGLFAVLDLGGATCDCAVVEGTATNNGFGSQVATLTIEGDKLLGGRDYDARLAGIMLDKAGITTSQLNDVQMFELNLSSETCKKDLTDTDTASAIVQGPDGPSMVTVTREEFVNATSDLTERVAALLEKTLSSEKLGGRKVKEVILAGGSSRMPIIRQTVEKLGYPVRTLDTPELSIALGLGKVAKGMLTEMVKDGETSATELNFKPVTVAGLMEAHKIITVLPKSYGTCAYRHGDRSKLFSSTIVEKDMRFPEDGVSPIQVTKHYAILDDGSFVAVEFTESNSADEWVDLGQGEDEAQVFQSVEFDFTRRVPAGTPLDVTITITPSGVIDYTALDVENPANTTTYRANRIARF